MGVLLITDKIWQDECTEEKQNGAWKYWKEIPESLGNYQGASISIYKGDITQLQIDAIVNAANDQGTGCYQPEHRCIDNAIHRRAGPRLRQSCRKAMQQRCEPLKAGTEPIVTPAYHLPSDYVIHVTGPQVTGKLTARHQHDLESAYTNVLDACLSNNCIKSVAFCGISTGLFGFPKVEAATIALRTVKKWLDDHPNAMEGVVFDVYSDEDEIIYERVLEELFVNKPDNSSSNGTVSNLDSNVGQLGISVAKHWIDEADSVLIVAGAGMSVKGSESVYTNPDDFARHYPFFDPKWGYKTCYETMGLFGDRRVPDEAKWALWAKHIDNMRWSFTPNDGYATLLDIVKEKDYFVLTSNVDGCFERSGFDKSRIYTPQGDYRYLQCMGPCSQNSVFEARPYLNKIIPQISRDGHIPEELIPVCPNCGESMFGNVRGGRWFLHHDKYEKENVALQQWIQDIVKTPDTKVAVIEVGAGMNTPMVTRFVSESIVGELGERGSLIRINPSQPEVPDGIRAVAIPAGWQILSDIEETSVQKVGYEDETVLRQLQEENELVTDKAMGHRIAAAFGHFNWRHFLHQLRG